MWLSDRVIEIYGIKSKNLCYWSKFAMRYILKSIFVLRGNY